MVRNNMEESYASESSDTVEKALDKDSFVPWVLFLALSIAYKRSWASNFSPFCFTFICKERETCGSFAKPLELIKKHNKNGLLVFLGQTHEL